METAVHNDLLDFYLGKRSHPSGFSIDEVLKWTDDQLAESHWALTWLFPTGLARKYSIERFKDDPELRRRLLASFCRVLDLYGFEPRVVNGNRMVVTPGPAFEQKSRRWLVPSSPHYRRITRVLETLAALGLEQAAAAFFEALRKVYEAHPGAVGYTTTLFWRDAAKR